MRAAWLILVASPLFGADLNRISSDSLRVNVTWLADDARGGRMTPSKGLEASADYLAERFREAGLKTSFQKGRGGRNVAGFLRGSDPVLRDQVVIVSAHYDHLGTKDGRVFHGANDDASGTASLIEIAKALAEGSPPRRSVLFLALFGEEEGLKGSKYYVAHPLFPIAKTVADVNLEQLGRTESSDGPEVSTFAFTGAGFSDLPGTMARAAAGEGVSVYKKDDGDDYFDRSDNASFADGGIVAHTVVVAFEFAEYHEPSDTADKIDYQNLAKVDRGLAAGIAAIANADDAPKWLINRPGKVRRGR